MHRTINWPEIRDQSSVVASSIRRSNKSGWPKTLSNIMMVLRNDVQKSILNGNFLMKSLMLGMLLAVDVGSAVAVEMKDQTFANFAACMSGGSLGVLVGISLYTGSWTIKDIRGLARESFGNCALAVMLGPIATFEVASRTGLQPNVYLMVAISGILGITGLTLLKALLPIGFNFIKAALKIPQNDSQTTPVP